MQACLAMTWARSDGPITTRIKSDGTPSSCPRGRIVPGTGCEPQTLGRYYALPAVVEETYFPEVWATTQVGVLEVITR